MNVAIAPGVCVATCGDSPAVAIILGTGTALLLIAMIVTWWRREVGRDTPGSMTPGHEVADFHPETGHLHTCEDRATCDCAAWLYAVAADAEARLYAPERLAAEVPCCPCCAGWKRSDPEGHVAALPHRKACRDCGQVAYEPERFAT